MKTKTQILNILTKLNGCQVTANQIQAHLTKPIGKNTINWHIKNFMRQGLIEAQRTSSKNGNVMRVK